MIKQSFKYIENRNRLPVTCYQPAQPSSQPGHQAPASQPATSQPGQPATQPPSQPPSHPATHPATSTRGGECFWRELLLERNYGKKGGGPSKKRGVPKSRVFTVKRRLTKNTIKDNVLTTKEVQKCISASEKRVKYGARWKTLNGRLTFAWFFTVFAARRFAQC